MTLFLHSHHYNPPDSVVYDSYRNICVCVRVCACGRMVVDRRQPLGAIALSMCVCLRASFMSGPGQKTEQKKEQHKIRCCLVNRVVKMLHAHPYSQKDTLTGWIKRQHMHRYSKRHTHTHTQLILITNSMFFSPLYSKCCSNSRWFTYG